MSGTVAVAIAVGPSEPCVGPFTFEPLPASTETECCLPVSESAGSLVKRTGTGAEVEELEELLVDGSVIVLGFCYLFRFETIEIL